MMLHVFQELLYTVLCLFKTTLCGLFTTDSTIIWIISIVTAMDLKACGDAISFSSFKSVTPSKSTIFNSLVFTTCKFN